MPSNWEERYDPSTKLNYFVDHAKKRASWTDPRTWYYDNDVTSTGGETNLRENNNEALSDRPYNFLSSEGNRSVKPSYASKTNSIVNKFLAKSYEPKHDQLQRRRKSSSTSRKMTFQEGPTMQYGAALLLFTAFPYRYFCTRILPAAAPFLPPCRNREPGIDKG